MENGQNVKRPIRVRAKPRWPLNTDKDSKMSAS